MHTAHLRVTKLRHQPLWPMGVGAGLLKLYPRQNHLACPSLLDLTPIASEVMVLTFPKSSWGALMQQPAWGPHFL